MERLEEVCTFFGCFCILGVVVSCACAIISYFFEVDFPLRWKSRNKRKSVVSCSLNAFGISHLAVVMDGNRRYAKKNSSSSLDFSVLNKICSEIFRQAFEHLLPPNNEEVAKKLELVRKLIRFTPLDGHRIGAEKVEEMVLHCIEAKISMLTVYAFSVENWNRVTHEVNVLMAVLLEVLYRLDHFSKKHGVFIRFIITETSRLPSGLISMMQLVESKSRFIQPRNITLNICLSYSGQTEIANACHSIVRVRLANQNNAPVTVEEVAYYMLRSLTQGDYEEADSNLFSFCSSEPQLIIRTGGDHRISNFLLFESAYSEFFFTDKKWPEFTKADLADALEEFSRRERRNGK